MGHVTSSWPKKIKQKKIKRKTRKQEAALKCTVNATGREGEGRQQREEELGEPIGLVKSRVQIVYELVSAMLICAARFMPRTPVRHVLGGEGRGKRWRGGGARDLGVNVCVCVCGREGEGVAAEVHVKRTCKRRTRAVAPPHLPFSRSTSAFSRSAYFLSLPSPPSLAYGN